MCKKRNRVEEEVGSNKGKGKLKVIRIKEMSNDKNYLPSICYTLSKEERRIFFESLYVITVPSWYSSNKKRFVTLNGKLKLGSM